MSKTVLRGWMPLAASEIRLKMRKHWWAVRYQPSNQEAEIVKIIAKHFAAWAGEPAELEARVYALECRRDELETELAEMERRLEEKVEEWGAVIEENAELENALSRAASRPAPLEADARRIVIVVERGKESDWPENNKPYFVAQSTTGHLVTADDQATATDMMLELLRDELETAKKAGRDWFEQQPPSQ